MSGSAGDCTWKRTWTSVKFQELFPHGRLCLGSSIRWQIVKNLKYVRRAVQIIDGSQNIYFMIDWCNVILYWALKLQRHIWFRTWVRKMHLPKLKRKSLSNDVIISGNFVWFVLIRWFGICWERNSQGYKQYYFVYQCLICRFNKRFIIRQWEKKVSSAFSHWMFIFNRNLTIYIPAFQL